MCCNHVKSETTTQTFTLHLRPSLVVWRTHKRRFCRFFFAVVRVSVRKFMIFLYMKTSPGHSRHHLPEVTRFIKLTVVFDRRLVGSDGVLLWPGIFLDVMVGGDDGVVGPKELVGWVGIVTDGRTDTVPTPRFTEVEQSVYDHARHFESPLPHPVCDFRRCVVGFFLFLMNQ